MSLEAVFSGASAIAGFGERFELGRKSMEASMQGTTFLPLSDHFMAVDIAEDSICKQAGGWDGRFPNGEEADNKHVLLLLVTVTCCLSSIKQQAVWNFS